LQNSALQPLYKINRQNKKEKGMEDKEMSKQLARTAYDLR
jgi:hypothetical protein